MKTLFFTIFLICFMLPTHACSLLAVTGENFVAGGGTIAFKNRDWTGTNQKISVVKPANGHKYLSVYSGKNFCVVGINENGLFVARSSAGSIPKAERATYPRWTNEEGLSTAEFMLRYLSSVEECINLSQDYFSEPVNFLVADANGAAYIEVAPNKTIAVKRISSGTIFHTNHYLEESTQGFNETASKSSKTRYNRLEEITDSHSGAYTFEDVINITTDRNAGPTNSIFRIGNGTPTSHRTTVRFVAHIFSENDAKIYVAYRSKPDATENDEIVETYQLSEVLAGPAGKISPVY